MLQMPLKAGQHRPSSETPFNSSLALIISGGPDPMSPLLIRAALDFEQPTYIEGGVGGGSR